MAYRPAKGSRRVTEASYPEYRVWVVVGYAICVAAVLFVAAVVAGLI